MVYHQQVVVNEVSLPKLYCFHGDVQWDGDQVIQQNEKRQKR